MIEEYPSPNRQKKVKDSVRGMTFNTTKDVEAYYRVYAKQEGFGVVKKNSRKLDGELVYFTIGCNKGGKSDSTSQNILKPQPVSRTRCKARASTKFLEEDKQWVVSNVTIEHNHKLSPGKSHYQRCHRKLTAHAKRKLELNDRADIKLNQNYNSLAVEVGGAENLPYIEKDCRNYIEKIRRLKLGEGDAAALENYFSRMQAKDPKFFYIIDHNDDNRIRNLFWADGRCRAAYEEFSDVISFDTTYLTNKYDMPFAPFVGVNHHGQSTLLGCGLLSSEDTDSFVWLFNSWLTCMSGKAPNAIITDQDRAMKKAIAIIFPKARHRWCIWHIMKKIPEKLNGYDQYEAIKFCLQNLVYNSLSENDFDIGWHAFLKKFSISDNEWLGGLYEDRHRWVPCFVNDCFWAGMSSTQRSESMNAFFDGYVNSKTTLKHFVEQYDNALRSKVEKERQADFKSFHSRIPLVTIYKMEEQIQEVYTLAKFKEFQEEITSLLYCEILCMRSFGSNLCYEISELKVYGEDKEHPKRVKFLVCFIEENGEGSFDVKCNCRLFESSGILCRHSILVLVKRDIFTLPSKYIVHRWKKNIKRRYTKIRVTYNDWGDTAEGRRYDRLCRTFYNVVDMAYESPEKCEQLEQWLLDLKESWKGDNIHPSSIKFQRSTNDLCDGSQSSKKLLSPVPKRSRGRPPSKRKQSMVEKKVAKLRKRAIRNGKTKKKGENISLNTNKSLVVASETQQSVSQILDSNDPHWYMSSSFTGLLNTPCEELLSLESFEVRNSDDAGMLLHSFEGDFRFSVSK